jgi:hypothetical protein
MDHTPTAILWALGLYMVTCICTGMDMITGTIVTQGGLDLCIMIRMEVEECPPGGIIALVLVLVKWQMLLLILGMEMIMDKFLKCIQTATWMNLHQVFLSLHPCQIPVRVWRDISDV